jgi:hypothetical protein
MEGSDSWGHNYDYGDDDDDEDDMRELARLRQVETDLVAALKELSRTARAVHSRDTCLADLAKEIQAVRQREASARPRAGGLQPRVPEAGDTVDPQLLQMQGELRDKTRETEDAVLARLPPADDLADAVSQLPDPDPFNKRVGDRKRGGGSKKRKTKKRKTKKRKSKTRRRRR